MRWTNQIRGCWWMLLACGAAACDEGTGPERPLRVQAVAGDAQTDTVGAVLAQALVAEVTDHRGEPVAGRTVEFAVISGGGSLQPATAQTDAQGRAQAQWTLGTRTSDAQRVEARVAQAPGGSAPDTFAATVRPGAAVRMEAVSPLRLSGVMGRPLADSVAVRIFDRLDNPAEGGRVQWVGTEASPELTYARADGTARTQWTLSRDEGEQTLQALDGYRAVTFTATGTRPPLDIVIELPYPAAYGDTVPIMADTRASANQPARVTASVDDRSTALRFSEGRWRGNLVLTGLAPGAKVMQAVVSDEMGNADTTHMSFIYDTPSVLTLEEPANGLAVGSYRVRAACQDNDPCTFTVRLGETLVAEVQGSIDQTFSLPAGIADSVRLRLRTQDGYGRVRTAENLLYAINHPDWTLVARLPAPPGGDVLDMNANRLLLRNGMVVERATGSAVQVFSEGSLESGFLTPYGAIVMQSNGGLWEWRNGVVTSPGGSWDRRLRVAGRWAVWRQPEPAPAYRTDVLTMLYDLETGNVRELDRVAGRNVELGDFYDVADVAANGDVVYLYHDHGLARYRNGTTTVLAPAPRYIRTDGNIVAYRAGGMDGVVRVIDAAGNNAEISPRDLATSNLSSHLVVRNGWVAYTVRENGAQPVWIRNPDGTQRKVTTHAGDSFIEALAPNGSLVFVGVIGPRAVFVPGRGVVTVGGPARQIPVFWVGDELYGSWGGGLFRIDY